jgi:excisionase family DNA binding protein
MGVAGDYGEQPEMKGGERGLDDTGKDRPPITLASAPDVLTVEEAASLLRLGRNGMYECIRRREIPVTKLGKRLLIAKTTIERLLAGEQF